MSDKLLIEPPHGKTNKMTRVPSEVSDQSSLCAQSVAKDTSFLRADGEDSDRTGRMPRLIWVLAGRTCHFVGFVVLRLNFAIIASLVGYDCGPS